MGNLCGKNEASKTTVSRPEGPIKVSLQSSKQFTEYSQKPNEKKGPSGTAMNVVEPLEADVKELA